MGMGNMRDIRNMGIINNMSKGHRVSQQGAKGDALKRGITEATPPGRGCHTSSS